ncbi:MAG: DUF222 domain-containing protein, partial [Candidatus Nanopelagicales bacterium]|nr:DUF222 domain-containing protein [Candidatus Nanopelagicales bacterium]
MSVAEFDESSEAGGVGCEASPPVAGAMSALMAAADATVPSGLGCGDVLAADVAVLSRMVHAAQAELARRLAAAEHQDALALQAHSTLCANGWASAAAHSLVAAARFVDSHPVCVGSWRTGQVGVERYARMESGTRVLDTDQTEDVAKALAPVLTELSVAQVARACSHAVALAKPDLAHRSEQDAHDERYLAFTRFRDISVFEGRLAGVDGKAFEEAVAACAESLRVEGDGLTRGQRNADALMLLVSKADLPKHGGLPAAVTLTMTMEQAEQVANTSPGQSHTESHTECGDTGVPHFAGGPPDAESGAGADSWSAGGAGLGGLGHDQVLGQGGARFGLCSCQITPVIAEPREPVDPRSLLNRFGLTQLQPVAVGRSVRLATPAQRRALAVRDGGCVIP